ncbi:unnamed protein product [Peronospora belbahrii]|uniref:Uncharacterized protein n=1 Tax=Peronospora belbahrii TaxID=622444 RepID=A0AAU9L8N2_9STRA|nr:unnamed protein product [Peronospora belbahrii]CAH0516509.1 unnamed protein product [Peronospora belbahrii]
MHQMRTPIDEVIGDVEDEWGIIHNPKFQRQQSRQSSSRIRMETTFRGVQVSLAIVAVQTPHVPPHRRRQRIRAMWAFDAELLDSPTTYCFVQRPMLDVGFLTLAHFEAYVLDRLEFAAHRYSEWFIGSRPSSIVPMSIVASRCPVREKTITRTCNKAVKKIEKTTKLLTQHYSLHTSDSKDNDKHQCVKQIQKMAKVSSVSWTQPVDIDPRYMNYEHSPAYRARRMENLARRNALQSSRRRSHQVHTSFK